MAHRNSESGFALIEVIVSAAVLAIVAMAVLSGIDAASNSSAREKARAVAASLAEQDQERMRAMSVETLAGLKETRPVPVDGVDYSVTSEATWVTDDQGGTPSCGNSSKNNEYLHISTTVTSKIVGRNVKAIKIDSLVAPSVAWSSTHGILGVKVVDRNGVGVPGVRVSPSTAGFAPASENTDPSGCAIFRQLPIGTYSIELAKGGYVDPEGKPVPVASQKVSPGVVTFKTFDYDLATSAQVTVTTNVPGKANVAQPSKATAISATNAKRIALLRNFPNASGANPVLADNLFPFKDSAYAFFTGNCAYQNPEILGLADYFKNNSGGLVADPTKTQPQGPVVVRQPPFNLRVARNSNSTLTVYAKLRKPAAYSTDVCAEPRVTMALKTWPSPAGTWGTEPSGSGLWAVRNDTTFDPGMPYGTYDICVLDTRPNPDQYQTLVYNNNVVGGQATTTNVTSSGSWVNGTCPA